MSKKILNFDLFVFALLVFLAALVENYGGVAWLVDPECAVLIKRTTFLFEATATVGF